MSSLQSLEEKLNHKIRSSTSYILKNSPAKIFIANDYDTSDCINPKRKVKVVFPLGLILHAFSFLKEDEKVTVEFEEWIKKAVKLLQKEGKDFYSINYWVRGSKYFKELPLPDDVDDTALVLTSFIRLGISFDERYFLKMLSLEEKPGGPYRTWYIGDKNIKTWMDIDPAVNAHLLYAAKLYGIDLKRCRNYVYKLLKNGDISSPYYLSELIFLYYCSKYYYLSRDNKFLMQLQSRLKDYKVSKLSDFEKIWFILCKLYIGENVSKFEIEEIFKLQQKDGSLRVMAIFKNFPAGGRDTYIGSEFTSIAYFIEALLLYRNIYFPIEKPKKDISTEKIESDIYQIIKKDLKNTTVSFNEVNKFIKQNKVLFFELPIGALLEISGLDRYKKNNLTKIYILAIIYSSAAYTLLDSIIDSETPPRSAAKTTTLLRLGLSYVSRLDSQIPGFDEAIQRSLDKTEKHYYKWGSIQIKKNKSASYNYINERMEVYYTAFSYLPLIAGTDSRPNKEIYKFIRAISVIKQLNDDAHDWEDDLKKRRDTYVVQKISLKKGDRSIRALKKFYWEKITDELIKICLSQERVARNCLKKLGSDNKYLNRVLDSVVQPIYQLRTEKKRVKNLLDNL